VSTSSIDQRRRWAHTAWRQMVRWSRNRLLGPGVRVYPNWLGPNGGENFQTWALQFSDVDGEWAVCKDLIEDTRIFSPATCLPVPMRWFKRFYRALDSFTVHQNSSDLLWYTDSSHNLRHPLPAQPTKEAAIEAWIASMLKWQQEYLPCLRKYCLSAEQRIVKLMRDCAEGKSELGLAKRRRF